MAELTKKNLINWLHSKKDNEIVGYAGEADSCPLATYYKENKTNVDCVAVTAGEVRYVKKYGNKIWVKVLPKWAKNFVAIIDEEFTVVSVEDALEVLNDV
jgi:hypothetical protein